MLKVQILNEIKKLKTPYPKVGEPLPSSLLVVSHHKMKGGRLVVVRRSKKPEDGIDNFILLKVDNKYRVIEDHGTFPSLSSAKKFVKNKIGVDLIDIEFH